MDKARIPDSDCDQLQYKWTRSLEILHLEKTDRFYEKKNSSNYYTVSTLTIKKKKKKRTKCPMLKYLQNKLSLSCFAINITRYRTTKDGESLLNCIRDSLGRVKLFFLPITCY